MKKLLISLIVSLGLMTAVPMTANAYNIVSQCGTSLNASSTSFCSDVTSAKSGVSSDPVISIIRAVIIVISWVTGVASVILIIISGIKFVTSGGDSAKVSSAKGTLVNALIGIAITILAQSIVVFVLNKFVNG